MTRIGQGYNWGQRSPRWAGITSEVVDIGGTRVHYLRAGADGTGPTHLLIHSMGSGSWSWMDVIGPLSARGMVIAPDLPGSGRSRPIRRGVGNAVADAQFLDDFTAALGIEHVVLHGHSMGGLVGGLFAGRVPHRVERLVLTSAPLPGLPDPPRFPAAWRVGLRVARPVADVLVGAAVHLKGSAWRRWADGRNSAGLASAMARGGTDASRISPELLSLVAEEIGRLMLPWRIEGAVDAALSVVRALTVDEASTREYLAAIQAPTLLLWGADDRVIPRRLVEEVKAAHPSWHSRTIDGIGHLLPWESPEFYVELAG
ncbi:MAG TPA: alpha/beta fold hydrolase [Candidatus Limnocylindrales bacterium]|nr:alpha/beta fold hydrolase [Candidatus Limnocylindrales bacterium]